MARKPTYEELEQRVNKLEGEALERRLAERVLRNNEDEWNSLVKNAPDIILKLDRDGKILFINRTVAGFTVEETIGKTVYEYIRPEHRDKIRESIKHIFKTGDVVSFEFMGTGPGGVLSWYSTRLGPIRVDGEIVAVTQFSTDISDRKRAEEAFRRQALRNEVILKTSLDAFVMFDIEGRILEVNDSTSRMYGYPSERLVGMSIVDFELIYDTHEKFRARAEQIMEKKFDRFETKHRCKDGRILDVEASVNYVNMGEGFFFCFLRDITERKRAEDALAREKEKFRILVEESPLGVALIARDGRYKYINPKFIKIFGYTEEDIQTGMDWFNKAFPDPKYREQAMTAWKNDLKDSKVGESRPRSFDVRCKDGSEKVIHFRPVSMEDQDQFIIYEDITERKRAEEALRDSEEKFRTVVENSKEGIAILQDDKIVYVNPRIERLSYFSKADIFSRDFLSFIHPDDRATASRRYSEVKNGKRFSEFHDYKVFDKKGNTRWVTVNSTDIKYREKPALLVFLTEITERKQAEVALRKSEQRYRLLAENVEDVIWTMDMDMNLTYVSPSVEHMRGYTVSQVMAQPLHEMLTPESYKKVRDTLFEELALEESKERPAPNRSRTVEVEQIRKDGSTLWTEIKATFLRDKEGKPIGVLGVTRDISERKEARAKLDEMLKQIKKSHDDLLSVLNMINLGIITLDEHSRITFLNQTAQQLIGKTRRAILGGHWLNVFSLQEDDRVRLQDMLQSPLDLRQKVQVHAEFHRGRRYFVEIEVLDDPRAPQRKMLVLYDMSEVYDLRRLLEQKAHFRDLVGRSDLMQSVYQRIEEVSSVDWTVVIEGETGTGKELVARAIHSSSHRKEKPFVTVDCAGLTDSLLSTQLFGHKRGAFTGAVEDHKGLFEVANGGTLFLDEIGDISKNLQTSLLRVLEEKEITRLGESMPRKIDIRILAATNRDLSQEVEMGYFRPDLLYRIRVARITLPPLRDRREDIPLLVEAFLGQSRAATGKPVKGISHKAMRVLLGYDWPGNVRELKSAIEFATLHCREPLIRAEDLPPEILYPGYPGEGVQPRDDKQLLLEALEGAKGNRTNAARRLGISRATLYRRLASLGIKTTEEQFPTPKDETDETPVRHP
jgi:PAS domain S-box-containing protein